MDAMITSVGIVELKVKMRFFPFILLDFLSIHKLLLSLHILACITGYFFPLSRLDICNLRFLGYCVVLNIKVCVVNWKSAVWKLINYIAMRCHLVQLGFHFSLMYSRSIDTGNIIHMCIYIITISPICNYTLQIHNNPFPWGTLYASISHPPSHAGAYNSDVPYLFGNRSGTLKRGNLYFLTKICV